MKRQIPSGIELLCYMYFVNVILYLLSLMLFENRILVLGKDAGLLAAWSVRFLLIFIPFFTALRLRKLKKEGWILALIFHVYFIINNCASFLESRGVAQKSGSIRWAAPPGSIDKIIRK